MNQIAIHVIVIFVVIYLFLVYTINELDLLLYICMIEFNHLRDRLGVSSCVSAQADTAAEKQG